MQSDHLRDQVGKCGGQCHGFDSIDDGGLCDFCRGAYEKVIAEDERLEGNKELAKVLAKLRKACNEDKTRAYQRIFDQSRYGEIIH